MIELYNDDFRNVLNAILQNHNNKKIIVVTDPPFNIGYRYNTYRDNLPEKEYEKLMYDAFGGVFKCYYSLP